VSVGSGFTMLACADGASDIVLATAKSTEPKRKRITGLPE
jgi:hypothetical protein